MKHAIRLVKNPLVCLAAAISFATLIDGETRGQAGPPAGQGSPSVINPKSTAREQEIRESRLRGAEFGAATENTRQQRIEAMVAQMKEDFARIQVVRNLIAHDLVARVPLNYRTVSDQTAEINKRSNRLKTFMMLEKSDEKDKGAKKPVDMGPDEMTSALVRLCKLIDGFVENPALKNAATLDAKHLEKAKTDKSKLDTDLVGIIELSGRIRQSAQKLEQTPQ